MRVLTLALASAAVLAVPMAAQAQSGLSSIFNCENPNNRQTAGTVVGALVGGLAGNQIADNDRRSGTAIGAIVGAAAGRYFGCQMSSADTQQAEAATLNALNQNRSTTWSNNRTGASGRVDVVNSFNRADPSARNANAGYDDRNDRGYDDRNDRSYDNRDRYAQQSLDNIRFARGVSRPASFDQENDRYMAPNRANLRASASPSARVVGQLGAGERFDTVASAGNGQWLLVTRDGIAVGYVSTSVVRSTGENRRDRNDYARNDSRQDGYGRDRQAQYQQATVVCRTFDQTVRTGTNSGPTTQRFTACQNANGQWTLDA